MRDERTAVAAGGSDDMLEPPHRPRTRARPRAASLFGVRPEQHDGEPHDTAGEPSESQYLTLLKLFLARQLES